LVDAFAHAVPDRLNSLLLANSGAHTARRIRGPATVRAVWLPPYGPGLNPIERVWRDRNDDVAWQLGTALAAHHEYGGGLVRAYEAPTLQALTAYPYLIEAMNALCR
jgi:hypothetical protein